VQPDVSSPVAGQQQPSFVAGSQRSDSAQLAPAGDSRLSATTTAVRARIGIVSLNRR
jgi:hypothetical protein